MCRTRWGQEPYLSEEAQEQVAEEIATGRFRTAGEIRDWVAEQYGVTYKMGGHIQSDAPVAV